MRFSPSFTSSTSSLPSPDGAYIATLLPSKLTIRETQSLRITRVITLPPQLSTSVAWFLWSPSSDRILVASARLISVWSARDARFSATIANPTSGTARMTYTSFGTKDDEIYVFSEFGLKLTIFNTSTSTSIEIDAPKLFNSGVAAKGFAHRPDTLNMAILTRSGGKDVISIHAGHSFKVVRSWLPDTIDAQGLSWSPDGRLLVVWESAAFGHKLILYTADGHRYKSWNGPIRSMCEERQISLGAGINLVEWNRTGCCLAVADHSIRVTLLTASSYSESSNLRHSTAINPSETLQVWQEQFYTLLAGGFERDFMQVMQTFCPPTSNFSTMNDINIKTGTNVLSFSRFGTLLATRVEHMPTTVWIWDIAMTLLRTVLILHSSVAKVTWHPTVDQLLMIRCEGEDSKGIVHLWDSSWAKPRIIDFGTQLPGGKILGKSTVRWLNVDAASPAIFFSDSLNCVLASISSVKETNLPWQSAELDGINNYEPLGNLSLDLISADKTQALASINNTRVGVESNWSNLSCDSNFVEDTFRFKKLVEPGDI